MDIPPNGFIAVLQYTTSENFVGPLPPHVFYVGHSEQEALEAVEKHKRVAWQVRLTHPRTLWILEILSGNASRCIHAEVFPATTNVNFGLDFTMLD